MQTKGELRLIGAANGSVAEMGGDRFLSADSVSQTANGVPTSRERETGPWRLDQERHDRNRFPAFAGLHIARGRRVP